MHVKLHTNFIFDIILQTLCKWEALCVSVHVRWFVGDKAEKRVIFNDEGNFHLIFSMYDAEKQILLIACI